MAFEIYIIIIAFLIVGLFLKWTTLIKIAMLTVVIEGAVRKWFLPSLSDFVYFIKDFILLYAYLKFYISNPKRIQIGGYRYFTHLLTISVGLVIVQVFNLRMESLLVGIFGFKAYFIYVPLCFLLPYMYTTQGEFERDLKIYILLIIPISVIGILQYFTPPDNILNAYVQSNEDFTVSTFGTEGDYGIARARITGTFSYINNYASYLTICFAIVLPMLTLGLKKASYIIYQCVLLLILGNMFMTGSRGPVFSAAFTLLSFIIFNPALRRAGRNSPFMPLFLASVIGVVGSLYFFNDAYSQFSERATSNDSNLERVILPFTQPFQYFYLTYPEVIGYGTGATHPGGFALRNRFNLPDPPVMPPPSENEPFRVLLELGAIGFILIYSVRIYLIYLLLKTWQSLEVPFLRYLSFAALSVHILNLSGQVIVNHTLSIYFWYMAGFIFLFPRLENNALIIKPALSLTSSRVRNLRGYPLAIRQAENKKSEQPV